MDKIAETATTESSTRLVNLANKYGDFKVAWGYARGEEKKFSKRQTVNELMKSDKGIQFLNKANCRQVLPCEIILDMDDNISEERLNKICDELDNYGFTYKAYSTGSKGYHIHIFDDDLVKYTEKSMHKIRHHLISKFQCDPQIASGNVLIALENVPHFKTGKVKTLVRESK
ncbi:hypothetical protein K9M74_01200 [Candidatus Woesearchaeota archaeon]|nr:hypothetical protein [Candidatus Woesearchaeota archaeon]